jgi:hypothetical protein
MNPLSEKNPINAAYGFVKSLISNNNSNVEWSKVVQNTKAIRLTNDAAC